MRTPFAPVFLCGLVAASVVCAQEAKPDAAAIELAARLKVQGEYHGKMREADFAIQVLAAGPGRYEAVLCPGGLPGAGWTMDPPVRQRVSATMLDGEMSVSGNGWSGKVDGGVIHLEDFKGTRIGRLTRVERLSSTSEAPAPEGALNLFDGKSLDAFAPGARVTPEGWLMEGCTTKQEFGDCKIHLEFKLPFMPEAKGQARGNSGAYVAGRYEVQILDSFGLRGEHDECGGIYKVARPKLNMCFPPEQWQTYDIDYQAPRFDDAGKKVSDVQVTVLHNGVLIHDKVSVSGPTTAAPMTTEGPVGPLHLQNHGNPVRFRNIWVLPAK